MLQSRCCAWVVVVDVSSLLQHDVGQLKPDNLERRTPNPCSQSRLASFCASTGQHRPARFSSPLTTTHAEEVNHFLHKPKASLLSTYLYIYAGRNQQISKLANQQVNKSTSVLTVESIMAGPPVSERRIEF